VLENQGLSAIAFFEATAFLILLVLFVLLRKDHPTRFLTIWITGWSLITIKAIFELTRTPDEAPQLRLVRILEDRKGGAVAGVEVRPDQGVEVRARAPRPAHRQVLHCILAN